MIVGKRMAGVLMGFSYFLPCGTFLDIFYPYNSIANIRYDSGNILIAVALLVAYYWPIATWYCAGKLFMKLRPSGINVIELLLCLFSALISFLDFYIFDISIISYSYGTYVFSVSIIIYATISLYELITARGALIIGGT